MKKTISVTLSKDLLATIDRFAANHKSRSAFIEEMLRQEISQMERAQQDVPDIDVQTRHLSEKEKEIEEFLRYKPTPR